MGVTGVSQIKMGSFVSLPVSCLGVSQQTRSDWNQGSLIWAVCSLGWGGVDSSTSYKYGFPPRHMLGVNLVWGTCIFNMWPFCLAFSHHQGYFQRCSLSSKMGYTFICTLMIYLSDRAPEMNPYRTQRQQQPSNLCRNMDSRSTCGRVHSCLRYLWNIMDT